MFSHVGFFVAGRKTPTRMPKAGGRGGIGKITVQQRYRLDVKCKQQVLKEKAQQVTKNQSTHEIL